MEFDKSSQPVNFNLNAPFVVSQDGLISPPQLLAFLKGLRKDSPLLIGVDGCGGSGKSTFAKLLRDSSAEREVVIVQMDDFYKPSAERTFNNEQKPVGADFDWERLHNQILLPLKSQKDAAYQRYDWNTDKLAEWQTIVPDGIVIIEGVTSTRKEVASFYDFRIWVECPYEIRLNRGIERDGESARDIWVNEWMPNETRYVTEHNSVKYANLIIDGKGTKGKDQFFAVNFNP